MRPNSPLNLQKSLASNIRQNGMTGATKMALWLALFVSAGSMAATSPIEIGLASKASVSNSCVVQSAQALSFGTYNPTSTGDAYSSSNIEIRCTKDTIFSVSNNGGMHNSAMQGPGGVMSYSLYQDAGMTKAFGASSTDFAANLPVGKYACFSGSNLSQYLGTSVDNNYTRGTNSPGVISGVVASTYDASTGNYRVYTGLFDGSGTAILNDPYPEPTFSTTAAGCRWSQNAILITSGNVNYGYTGDITQDRTTHLYVASLNQAIAGKTLSALEPLTLPFYGKVRAQQDLTPGIYSDIVTFTITF